MFKCKVSWKTEIGPTNFPKYNLLKTPEKEMRNEVMTKLTHEKRTATEKPPWNGKKKNKKKKKKNCIRVIGDDSNSRESSSIILIQLQILGIHSVLTFFFSEKKKKKKKIQKSKCRLLQL